MLSIWVIIVRWLTTGHPRIIKFQNSNMMLLREGYVLSEKFVIVRRFSQTFQAHKLNMTKREKLARHPRTIWRIWACDVTPTSRIHHTIKCRNLYRLSVYGLWRVCTKQWVYQNDKDYVVGEVFPWGGNSVIFSVCASISRTGVQQFNCMKSISDRPKVP